MRTITEAAAWVKENDPKTGLTKTAIRRLVLAGEIPHVEIGRKRLIALEDLTRYLEQGGGPQSIASGVVRPVEVHQ